MTPYKAFTLFINEDYMIKTATSCNNYIKEKSTKDAKVKNGKLFKFYENNIEIIDIKEIFF